MGRWGPMLCLGIRVGGQVETGATKVTYNPGVFRELRIGRILNRALGSTSGKAERALRAVALGAEELFIRGATQLGLRPSVISMLDSLHLAKVFVGDLPWS